MGQVFYHSKPKAILREIQGLRQPRQRPLMNRPKKLRKRKGSKKTRQWCHQGPSKAVGGQGWGFRPLRILCLLGLILPLPLPLPWASCVAWLFRDPDPQSGWLNYEPPPSPWLRFIPDFAGWPVISKIFSSFLKTKILRANGAVTSLWDRSFHKTTKKNYKIIKNREKKKKKKPPP